MHKNDGIIQALIKAESAHKKFELEQGKDDNWAKWYANYLLNNTEFSNYTSRSWDELDLTDALTQLDASYRRIQPRHHWTVYYSSRLET